MYIYFDSNGTIKEIVNDVAIRKGSADYNKLYVYIEGNPEIDDIWYFQKFPNGSTSNEVSFINNVVIKSIPYDAKRDMTYFKDFVQYKFYVFTLTSEYLNISGLAIGTIRIAVDSTIFALGELTFNIQANEVNADNNITQSQYNYLLLAYASRTLSEYTSRDLENYIDYIINAKVEELNPLQPSGTGTTAYITSQTSDIGILISTDNGHWYYWNGTQYVEGGTYQAVQISNYSVTPIKTTFFDINKSRNLFNIDSITSGKTFNGTEIVDNASRYISDYISVEIGKTIYFSYKTPRQALTIYKVVAYDINKQPLSSSNSWLNNYTIPDGCYYIRFSAENSSLSENVQAEYDSITTYEPYYDYEIIKEINLPKELYNSCINIIKNNDNYDITMGKYTFRFYKAYSTTNNLDSYDINNIYMDNTQIEFGNILGVIKETNQDDFMGGVAHGDEQIISMNIYCDGIPITQSTSGYKVDIFLISNLKRVSDHTTNVAKRIVHIIFQNNTMTIKTNFIVLVDNFNIDFVYVGMWGQLLSQTTKLFTNMNEYDLDSPSNYNSTKVFNSSYVNPNGIVDISIIKGFEYPNYRFAFVYYSDTQRVKNYFTLAQNETFNTDDVLYGVTEYKFN